MNELLPDEQPNKKQAEIAIKKKLKKCEPDIAVDEDVAIAADNSIDAERKSIIKSNSRIEHPTSRNHMHHITDNNRSKTATKVTFTTKKSA